MTCICKQGATRQVGRRAAIIRQFICLACVSYVRTAGDARRNQAYKGSPCHCFGAPPHHSCLPRLFICKKISTDICCQSISLESLKNYKYIQEAFWPQECD